MINSTISPELAADVGPALARIQTTLEANPALQLLVQDFATLLLAIANHSPAKTCSATEIAAKTNLPTVEQVNQPAQEIKPAATPHLVINSTATKSNGTSASTSTNGESIQSLVESALRSNIVVRKPTWQSYSTSDSDLPLIIERCRLKAEGARWAHQREVLLRENSGFNIEVEGRDREIIYRAKMTQECFLWMCHRDRPMPDDLSKYDTVAFAFENAAKIVAYINNLMQNGEDERKKFLEPALILAAEAQSSLRVAIEAIAGPADPDQTRIFNWLRTVCAERKVLIERHMRWDDPADPADAEGLLQRIEKLETEYLSSKDRGKRQKNLFGKVKYHSKDLFKANERLRSENWLKIIEAVEELLAEGVQPSNRELRDLLAPVIDTLPDSIETSKNFAVVLREIDRFLATEPTPIAEPESNHASEALVRAAELMKGRTAVLIGGDRRPQAVETLEKAFGLKELVWIEGRDQTYVEFEPYIARDDVAIVILAIRWSRHGFGEVKHFCEQYNKPLVRLPGGYSPNQVAHHILSQVADRVSAQAVLQP